jgi:hypothetical protein
MGPCSLLSAMWSRRPSLQVSGARPVRHTTSPAQPSPGSRRQLGNLGERAENLTFCAQDDDTYTTPEHTYLSTRHNNPYRTDTQTLIAL